MISLRLHQRTCQHCKRSFLAANERARSCLPCQDERRAAAEQRRRQRRMAAKEQEKQSEGTFEETLFDRIGRDAYAPQINEQFAPTDAPPGTLRKIEVMSRRVLDEVPLFHPDDNLCFSPESDLPIRRSCMPKKAKRERTIPVYDEGGSLDCEVQSPEEVLAASEDGGEAPAAESQCEEAAPSVLTEAEAAFENRRTELESEIARRSVALARLKSQAKIEADALRVAVDELAEHERRGPEHMPLFDQKAGEDGSVPPTPWRGLPLTTLRLNASIESKLTDAELDTMGLLFDMMQRYEARWFEQVPGIGPELALVIADAWAMFWQDHPEYRADAQEEAA